MDWFSTFNIYLLIIHISLTQYDLTKISTTLESLASLQSSAVQPSKLFSTIFTNSGSTLVHNIDWGLHHIGNKPHFNFLHIRLGLTKPVSITKPTPSAGSHHKPKAKPKPGNMPLKPPVGLGEVHGIMNSKIEPAEQATEKEYDGQMSALNYVGVGSGSSINLGFGGSGNSEIGGNFGASFGSSFGTSASLIGSNNRISTIGASGLSGSTGNNGFMLGTFNPQPIKVGILGQGSGSAGSQSSIQGSISSEYHGSINLSGSSNGFGNGIIGGGIIFG